MTSDSASHSLRRFSSRRQPLGKSFLCQRLRGAQSYDRIAGYFCSSLLEIAGEEIESMGGRVRMVCNSDLSPEDVATARAANMAVRKSWCAFEPEKLLEGRAAPKVRERYRWLFELLRSGKLEVRVLPDEVFGLIHGKAGVITLESGLKTSFMGSANESKSAWKLNYELVWEDESPEGVQWVQEEFEALWNSPAHVPLAEAVVEDIERLSKRKVIRSIPEWMKEAAGEPPAAPPAVIETPVFRKEVGLWEHQKYFVKLVLDWHHGPLKKARFVLADQVGLGKTLQLAMSAMLIALTGDKPALVVCPKTLIWQWQGEMRDLLDMPSAVWDGRNWIDENGIEHPSNGPESIRRCPRRVGIVSSGLITRASQAAGQLLNLSYDCVVNALQANPDPDPKYEVVRQCLLERGWLRRGCIIFSQYRDSVLWLAEQLTAELPEEPIAIYSGPSTSGVMYGGEWFAKSRDDLKQMVREGTLRLMLGTDAASEGLNLQRLATLINLDLPWNPTRLEQRKGRIQRIGQIHDTVDIYNMRYADSVEDRVHQLLSDRLKDIHNLFGQIPDILEDVWVALAEGEKEQATKIIDKLPKSHPFELRYTHVGKTDWESCSDVLDAGEKMSVLLRGWK